MGIYSYINEEKKDNTSFLSGVADNVKTVFGSLRKRGSSPKQSSSISSDHSIPLERHVFLLIMQAIFLVGLSLVFIGFELRANRLEAETAPLMLEYQKANNKVIAMSQQSSASEKIADVSTATGHNTTLSSQSNVKQDAKSNNEEDGSSSTTQKDTKAVLGAESDSTADSYHRSLPRSEYAIAILGDSMIDTMGKDCKYLHDALEEKYPDVNFVIFNYGKGGRTVSQGLEDFDKPFKYKDRDYPSIADADPDIIIVGSFAYNLYDPHDRDRHWVEYTRLVQKAQEVSPHVYMLAEIAPYRSGFGLGPNGIMWDPHTAWAYTGKIIEQLENVVSLSEALQVQLIDAYSASLVIGTKEGQRALIDQSDNIHPSPEGHKFIAKMIVEGVDFEKIDEERFGL